MQQSASPSQRFQENNGSLPSRDKRELVQRVIKGKSFSRSPAMRAFLLYVTEHEISGRADQLKEQIIGSEVLGRKPNYDPADDNIVRVRAHELRERLGKFFASEGAGEPYIITIPKGTYAPEFVARESLTPATAKPQVVEVLPVPSQKPPSQRLYWLLLGTLVFLGAILASVALTRYALRGENRASGLASSPSIRDFWGQFFERPNEEMRVVYADTNFALWQDMNEKNLNLGDYLGHKYLDNPDDLLREVATRRSTSPADLSVSVRLATVAGGFGGRLNALFARNANAEFFHQGNVVLIGSHRSNPWVELYEPSLNFVLEQDPHSGAPLFRNRAPQSGEAATYGIPEMLDIKGDERKEFASYGLLALLKDCGGRGLIVLDEGLNMQATQAVGETITDPQRLDTLLRRIGHKSGTNVLPFEALIQITSLPGGYDNPIVIAYRLRSGDSCVTR